MIMKKEELKKSKEKIIKHIKENDNFAILISDPDGDAVGSGLAMQEILQKMDKECKLYSSFELPDFTYLPRFGKYIIKDIATIDFTKFNSLIVLDSAHTYRLINKKIHPKGFDLPKDKFVINIDHHLDNSLFGNLNYVPDDPIISSVGEALYDIFHNEVNITSSIATNIFAAIVGDTGCFRYSNTSPSTFIAASKLLKAGSNMRQVIKNTFYNFEEKIVKMNIQAAQKIKIINSGKYKFAYTIINPDEFDLEYASRGQLFIIQEILKSTKGTNFSLKITKLKKDLTKLSFRSHDTAVRKIAKHMGGGGHEEAAGAIVQLPINECLKKLTKFLKTAKLTKLF